MKVPISRTCLLDEDIQSVLEPLENGWLVQGPRVAEFEALWSQFTGSKYSIAVTSCTSALHLSLAALGFGPGDEAIVPAFTWISTANVVEHLGGKVVFADIDISTFNIDPLHIEALITPRTKAIIPVHLFGLAADMSPIIRLARNYNLAVVEDAACGFGSYIDTVHVGTHGDTGCFSFHPRKSITTGEGGMITTNDDDLVTYLRRLRDHGASLTDLQRHLGARPYLLSDHPDAGYNQRMTDIQASLGSSQMKRANTILEERRTLAYNYNKAFAHTESLRVPVQPYGFSHGYQSYPCLFEPSMVEEALLAKDYDKLLKISSLRNRLMDLLQSKGISTRPATHAVHMLEFYRKKYNLQSEAYPCSMAANYCSLSLPLFNGMTSEEQSFVIESLYSLL